MSQAFPVIMPVCCLLLSSTQSVQVLESDRSLILGLESELQPDFLGPESELIIRIIIYIYNICIVPLGRKYYRGAGAWSTKIFTP